MFGREKDTQKDVELFVVFDSKSKSYDLPMMAKNKDTFLRDILNEFRTPECQQKSKFFINAEDFSIYRIGHFTKHDGKLEIQNHEHVANMHDLRALVSPVSDNANAPALLPT